MNPGDILKPTSDLFELAVVLDIENDQVTLLATKPDGVELYTEALWIVEQSHEVDNG